MAGYSGKTVVQKLGIRPGFRIFAAGLRVAYNDIVGKLPADVTIVSRLAAKAPLDMVHVFATEAAGLAGFPIIDQLHRFHFTVTLEQCLHVLFGGIEWQVAHINRRHPGLSLGKADSGVPHASVACTA